MKIDVLGIQFDHISLEQAVAQGLEMVAGDTAHYVVTPNPEFILDSQRNEDFRQTLNGADLVIPDGIGVIYASKILGTPLTARVPGIDFATGLLDRLNVQGGGRLFLLGAKPGVAEDAARNLGERYPNITICGTQDGYFKDEGAVVEQVKLAQPNLLFVCLGAPKQERFMATHRQEMGAGLAVGLGGALDVFAGRVERAPALWQKLGMEWAYRLVKEPSRLGRMARLPLVLVQALKVRIFGGNRH